jgi:hypothetical protein
MTENGPNDFSLLATVQDPFEAHLIKGLLESHGIEVTILPKEAGNVIDPMESAGQPIHIMVMETDMEDASLILDAAESYAEEDIARETKAEHKRKFPKIPMGGIWLTAALICGFAGYEAASASEPEVGPMLLFAVLTVLFLTLYRKSAD